MLHLFVEIFSANIKYLKKKLNEKSDLLLANNKYLNIKQKSESLSEKKNQVFKHQINERTAFSRHQVFEELNKISSLQVHRFVDQNFNVIHMNVCVCFREGDDEGKAENAEYHYYFFFPVLTIFSKVLIRGVG